MDLSVSSPLFCPRLHNDFAFKSSARKVNSDRAMARLYTGVGGDRGKCRGTYCWYCPASSGKTNLDFSTTDLHNMPNGCNSPYNEILDLGSIFGTSSKTQLTQIIIISVGSGSFPGREGAAHSARRRPAIPAAGVVGERVARGCRGGGRPGGVLLPGRAGAVWWWGGGGARRPQFNFLSERRVREEPE